MEISNNETRKFSYTLCTRIIHHVVSENRKKETKTTIQEIYDKFEEFFRWVETKGGIKFPNDDYYTKCDKIYQEPFKEALWRLKQILKTNKQEQFLIEEGDPLELSYQKRKKDKDGPYYNFYKPTIFGGVTAVGNTMNPVPLECAFIIDDILSTGRHISNDEIYEELNSVFNKVDVLRSDYKAECHSEYKEISKQAIQKIKDILKDKGFVIKEIFKWVKISDHVKKFEYWYNAEPGFSAFKTTGPTYVNPLEVKFEAFVSKLSSKDKLPLTRLYDILERVDLTSSSDTGSIEGDVKKHLHKIESLFQYKSNNYLIECDKEFKLLFSKYKNHIAPKDYANLLVLYADFIYEFGLSKEFKGSIDLETGWYSTIANSLETAVNTISTTEYTKLYISYALKYVRFVTRYSRTELYDKIELLYSEIFNRLQNDNTPLMAYALRSYAMLCYFRKNIDLCIETLERAQYICRSKINDSVNVDYLNEYIFATKELADIFFDYLEGERRDINRSIKEYKDVVKYYCYLVEDNPHLGFEFIHLVYYRLAVLYCELNDYKEVEKMREKCALLSLSYAIKEKDQKYVEKFEYDIIDWATALRIAFGTTLKESYIQALNQYMQIGIKLSSTASKTNCKVIPKNYFSEFLVEVNLFQRIKQYRANQNSVENKISLAEELENIGDLHCKITHSDAHEIIEKEYREALDIYQTINEDHRYTFTMLNLLGKLSKSFVSQRKMSEAGRMYGMLYNLLCKYIEVEGEDLKLYKIDIAHLMTDYASFLECNNEIDNSISVYEHALSFCDRISVHEQDTIELLIPDNSLPATVLPSKAIKCDIFKNIAKIYEHTEQIEKADAAYRKSIDFLLQEERNNPGAYVVYIILQLEDFADMLKNHKSYKDADSMIAHYLEVIDSSRECYDVLISKLPEFNWIKEAKQSVEYIREIAKNEDPLEGNLLLAEQLERLAELQCIYKEYTDAVDNYLEMISIFHEIEKDRPGLYTHELANAYSSIAFVYKELGHIKEAIESYDKAVTLYKKRSLLDPSDINIISQCLKAQAELYDLLKNKI